MSVLFRVVCALGVMCGSSASPVLAAPVDSSCTCTAEAIGGTTFIGSLTAVTGTVLVSGQGMAKQGTPLRFGSQIITGEDGSARLVASTCSQQISPNSEAMVSRAGGNICVSVRKIDALDLSYTDVNASSLPMISPVSLVRRGSVRTSSAAIVSDAPVPLEVAAASAAATTTTATFGAPSAATATTTATSSFVPVVITLAIVGGVTAAFTLGGGDDGASE